MHQPAASETTALQEIDNALAGGWFPPLPPALRGDYEREAERRRRSINPFIACILIGTFELFWFAQPRDQPNLLHLSALLRLYVMLPALVIFLWLDKWNKLGRFWGNAALALTLLPQVITTILFLSCFNHPVLPNIRATPLLLLGSGLLAQLRPSTQIVNCVISTALFVVPLLLCPAIEQTESRSLCLMEVSVAVIAIVITLQREGNARRIFLLHAGDKIRRAMLGSENLSLAHETRTDSLTGIANRRAFDEALAAAWHQAQLHSGSLVLIMLDIDHFKQFNDRYGHPAGDECLRRTAQEILNHIRKRDIAARYGGEEFAVILPATDRAAGELVAERIRRGIGNMMLEQGLSVTVSLGLEAAVVTSADGARDLVHRADTNLYAAKTGGRNQVYSGPCLPASPASGAGLAATPQSRHQSREHRRHLPSGGVVEEISGERRHPILQQPDEPP